MHLMNITDKYCKDLFFWQNEKKMEGVERKRQWGRKEREKKVLAILHPISIETSENFSFENENDKHASHSWTEIINF